MVSFIFQIKISLFHNDFSLVSLINKLTVVNLVSVIENSFISW